MRELSVAAPLEPAVAEGWLRQREEPLQPSGEVGVGAGGVAALCKGERLEEGGEAVCRGEKSHDPRRAPRAHVHEHGRRGDATGRHAGEAAGAATVAYRHSPQQQRDGGVDAGGEAEVGGERVGPRYARGGGDGAAPGRPEGGCLPSRVYDDGHQSGRSRNRARRGPAPPRLERLDEGGLHQDPAHRSAGDSGRAGGGRGEDEGTARADAAPDGEDGAADLEHGRVEGPRELRSGVRVDREGGQARPVGHGADRRLLCLRLLAQQLAVCGGRQVEAQVVQPPRGDVDVKAGARELGEELARTGG
mmetsp:Transcript_31331/g.104694  ORF Transcript_31331/g.104694 Transcript_31331/m.104694 type:complete len:304 (-) Transcript_31331:576-1487(-)